MTRLIAPRRLLLSFAFVTTTLLQAQQPGEPEREWVRETRYQPSPLRLAGEFPGSALSRPGHTADWPAITYGVDDALYCAYVEWDGKQADRVVARIHKPHIGPSDPIEVSGWGDHYSPAIAATPDGALVVWSRQVDGNFELFSRTLSPEGELSVPYRLTRSPHSDFNVKTVSDGAGNVIIAWQSFRNGNSDIYARRFNGDAWGPEVRISTSDANDWQPAVALDSSGTAWVSWDSYHHGNYDVFLRSFNGTRPGEVIPITTETAAQFHSSVAVDADDRVWVAWDEGGENWGKDFSRSSAVDGSRGLYNSRSIGLRVWANGRLQQPSADVSQVLSGGMTRYAALPHLAFDGSGALWLLFRHWTLSEPITAHQFFATHLSGGKWSLPSRLSKSSGRATQFASLARTPMGRTTVAYAGDGRSADNVPTEQLHALHYRAYVTDLPKTNQPVAAQLTEVTLPRPAERPPRRRPSRLPVVVDAKGRRLDDARARVRRHL